jgi:hypothetical protein
MNRHLLRSGCWVLVLGVVACAGMGCGVSNPYDRLELDRPVSADLQETERNEQGLKRSKDVEIPDPLWPVENGYVCVMCGTDMDFSFIEARLVFDIRLIEKAAAIWQRWRNGRPRGWHRRLGPKTMAELKGLGWHGHGMSYHLLTGLAFRRAEQLKKGHAKTLPEYIEAIFTGGKWHFYEPEESCGVLLRKPVSKENKAKIIQFLWLNMVNEEGELKAYFGSDGHGWRYPKMVPNRREIRLDEDNRKELDHLDPNNREFILRWAENPPQPQRVKFAGKEIMAYIYGDWSLSFLLVPDIGMLCSGDMGDINDAYKKENIAWYGVVYMVPSLDFIHIEDEYISLRPDRD